MSGYTGNPDAEAEHAYILSENAIHAARQAMSGQVLDDCIECGIAIPTERKAVMLKNQMCCVRCLPCQEAFDKLPKRHIKMLDRIL